MYNSLAISKCPRVCLFYATKCNYSVVNKPQKKAKYSDTVLLPQTLFPQYLNGQKVVERDKFIQKECEFLECYAWQRSHMRGKEFILHDGPPYANGKPHIGHAINKILKDITLRCNMINGKRVHYIPGWDCHGLPIELKTLSKSDKELTPTNIRFKAREFARSATTVQMEAFKSWGVLGDWDKQIYYTFDKAYVANQLQVFWKLYEKGLLFRDLKPVYWSPSSRSALAESELIYKSDHKSTAVYVALEVTEGVLSEPTYLLIWTTTPWTLPANQAVCFNKNIQYSVVSISSGNEHYIIANDMIPTLQQKLNCDINKICPVTNNQLEAMKYKHPFFKTEIRPVVDSGHVHTLSGTGLVHTAPAHGQDDFKVGLAHGLTLDCLVDESGYFTPQAGPDLMGFNILKDANQRVIDKLCSKVLLQEIYTHSYPYDWRTNKPVIIRASQQWFVDTEALKNRAIECLSTISSSETRLESLVKSRPYWCISRQRLWGVPIPVFYHACSGRPLVSKSLVDHLTGLFNNDSDAWWTIPKCDLFPSKIREELCVRIEEVVQGDDIMDIWLDSGISWSSVMKGRVSDICIEGEDQFTGWFQSSLLTSVALQNKAPYKKLLTHGFTVDEEGRKMSKSVGNVVDPDTVTTGKSALGVDTLRWFVASHSHHSQIPVSPRIMKNNFEAVQKIRLVLRFILGALKDVTEKEISDVELLHIDRYMLQQCSDLYESVLKSYNTQSYNQVTLNYTNFVATSVSALYLHIIKDRLYCDPVTSNRRKACRFVLLQLLTTLCHSIAPILPHLAEEVYLYHPLYKNQRIFYKTEAWKPLSLCYNSEENAMMKLALEIKEEIDRLSGAGGCQNLEALIQLNLNDWKSLNRMQYDETSQDSELTELFQVSKVTLQSTDNTSRFNVHLSATTNERCPRCRRYSSTFLDSLCNRCENIVRL